MQLPIRLFSSCLLLGIFGVSIPHYANSRDGGADEAVSVEQTESSDEQSLFVRIATDMMSTTATIERPKLDISDPDRFAEDKKWADEVRRRQLESIEKDKSPGVRELIPVLRQNAPEVLSKHLGDDFDPNEVVYERDGTTLMHMAADYDADRVVKMLVDRGGLIDVKNKYGKSPLRISLGMDSIHDVEPREAAEVLIRSGADITLSNARGVTALHLAAENGRPELIELLISKGANVNAKQYNGDTPLHLATRECLKAGRYGTEGRYFSAIRALLDHGSQVNDQGANRHAPMDIAKLQQHQELLKLLAEYGGETTLELDLEQAIYSGDIDYFKKNYSEDSDREMGGRLLKVAAFDGEPEIITYLLTLGIPVDASSSKMITPLHSSAITGSLEAARVLINYGADVNS